MPLTGLLLLQEIFGFMARTRSSETFVALSLLVSVGMGMVAKGLGLTDKAGAFTAEVLLANTNFRAQIQADVLPFKGILLGIFFMDGESTQSGQVAKRSSDQVVRLPKGPSLLSFDSTFFIPSMHNYYFCHPSWESF